MILIDGVKIKKLNIIADERGRLAEILRVDDEIFEQFGQTYFTTAFPGVVKAWHFHKNQRDNFTAIQGMIKLVLYDSREDSPTYKTINEFFIGEHKPMLVSIPPVVYHGFKCISPGEAIVINVPTMPYNHDNPDEYRLEAHTPEIPYDWARKDS